MLTYNKKKSGRVDLNHRPQRPERCALNRTALRPVANSISSAVVNSNIPY